MPKEIERKFLIKDFDFKKGNTGVLIKQGYICKEPERVVRVRTMDHIGFITIKGKNVGYSRDEFEYEIPVGDALEMLNKLCVGYITEKIRYEIKYKDNIWTIDEFLGDNKGLVFAEIELKKDDDNFEIPNWIGGEVTSDYRYSGSNISINPYKFWEK